MKRNFRFNLLPKETFDLREKLKLKIDRVTILSALLPLLAVVIWTAFLLVSSFIQSQINDIQKQQIIVEKNISDLQNFKDTKALLVLKTRSLENIIKLDINPENFFDIIQSILDELDINVRVKSYGRNSNGSFYIDAQSDNKNAPVILNRVFRTNERLENVELISLSFDDDSNNVQFRITFNILNPVQTAT